MPRSGRLGERRNRTTFNKINPLNELVQAAAASKHTRDPVRRQGLLFAVGLAYRSSGPLLCPPIIRVLVADRVGPIDKLYRHPNIIFGRKLALQSLFSETVQFLLFLNYCLHCGHLPPLPAPLSPSWRNGKGPNQGPRAYPLHRPAEPCP